MVTRLLCLCGVEVVIVALLAWQVFAAPAAGPAVLVEPPAVEMAPDARSAAARGVIVEAPAANAAVADGGERAQVAAPQRSDDPVGVLLTGRVSFSDGSPAGINLYLVREGERRGPVADVAEDGSYAVVGLRPGAWTAMLSGQDVVDEKVALELDAAAVQRRDFTVRRSFTVKVRIVTPDGKDGTQALREALPQWSTPYVVGGSEPFPEQLAATDYGMLFVGDGDWSPVQNPVDGFAGTIALSSLPAHVALLQRHLVLQQQVVVEGQQQVEFVVDPSALDDRSASVAMRVVDAETGAPVTDARVSWMTSNRGGGGQLVDAEGRFVAAGLAPGWLHGRVWSMGHEPFQQTLLFQPGQRVDLGDVRLGAVLPIEGKVLGIDGKLGECSLMATPLKWRSGPAAFMRNHSYAVDADGNFKLSFGAGPIAIRASTREGVAATVFDNPSTTPLVLQLAKPGECVVTRPPDPQRCFVLSFLDAAGRVVDAWELTSQTPRLTLKMPFGSYRYEVHDDSGRQVATGEVTFGATPTKVEIR